MIKTTKGHVTLELNKRIRQLERSLVVVDNRLVATVPFLVSLSRMLSDVWRRQVTVTESYQVWLAASLVESHLAAKHQSKADVAYWFNVNPYTIDEQTFAGLHANMSRVQAQYQLLTGNYDASDPQLVYDLTMIAFDDESLALAARASTIRMLMNQ